MAVAAKSKGKSKAKPPKELDAAGVSAERLAAANDESGKPDSDKKAKVQNWADKADSTAYTEAAELYPKIQKCYDNKSEQNDKIEEYWNIHSAQPDENCQYTGNSQCYIPSVRDAIQARMKRSLAQLFPANHKHVEAVGPSGESPQGQLALLEHYIRTCKLKNIVRACLISGDVTGQWNLYVDWKKSYRRITEIVQQPKIRKHVALDVEIEDADETEETLKDREIVTEGPDIVPVATEDVAVYPPTVDSVEAATATSIKLRMSKERVQQLIEEGVFVGVHATDLMEGLAKPDGSRDRLVPTKKRTSDAGIKTEGTYKYALIYEVSANLELDGKRKEPALIYFAGSEPIGIIRNPFWCGRNPLISAAIEEITGSFFGISKVEPVKFLQWNLNDYWNMGMDSAQYALLPIIMTDPAKNPQYQSMVMGLAAVWLTDPNSTKFASFPALWKDSMQICQGIKSQIYESMDVNDAMMGKMPPGRKNNQMVGNLQQEQQINIVDHAKRFEEMILNPLCERIVELDQQFRTDDITVETRGELGVKAMLQPIEPQQMGTTFFFRWQGTAYQQNMQRQQQMIAWMNVLKGTPPQMLNGRRLDVTPILEFITEQVCGPEIAPRVLIDERNLFTIDPDIENDMLASGLPVELHAGDDDMKHITAHNEAAKITTDPAGLYRTHMMAHAKRLQERAQQAAGAAQQQPGGMPGAPGGAGPGVAGAPRPGAMPGLPRPQQPPGAIQQDAMAGAPGRG